MILAKTCVINYQTFCWWYIFFSVVHDVDVSAKQLNDDLNKISEGAFQWKMAFSPDLSKQAQEIVFSPKTQNNSS